MVSDMPSVRGLGPRDEPNDMTEPPVAWKLLRLGTLSVRSIQGWGEGWLKAGLCRPVGRAVAWGNIAAIILQTSYTYTQTFWYKVFFIIGTQRIVKGGRCFEFVTYIHIINHIQLPVVMPISETAKYHGDQTSDLLTSYTYLGGLRQCELHSICPKLLHIYCC